MRLLPSARELVVIVAILAAITPCAYDSLMMVREKRWDLEGATNIMNIAIELEHGFEASGSYSNGGPGDGCPGTAVYVGHGAPVGTHAVAVQGDYFQYEVTTHDDDGDGRCERYEVRDRGVLEPALGYTRAVTSSGEKLGPWLIRDEGICGCTSFEPPPNAPRDR